MKSDISIGFLGLLQLVFIILKLTGFVDWSWIYVLMPYGIPAVLGIIFGIISIILYFEEKVRAKKEMERVKKQVKKRKKKTNKK